MTKTRIDIAEDKLYIEGEINPDEDIRELHMTQTAFLPGLKGQSFAALTVDGPLGKDKVLKIFKKNDGFHVIISNGMFLSIPIHAVKMWFPSNPIKLHETTGRMNLDKGRDKLAKQRAEEKDKK